MASSLEFVEYVFEQISDAGNVSYKKMFGEYGLYCDGKVFGLICDNQLFVKVTEAGKAILPDCETDSPYKGAKPHFLISDLEDRALLAALIQNTCAELPTPKPKKKKIEQS